MAGTGARRVRLDREMIIDALLGLARSEPNAKITFKRLGDALGVDATAMYRHFRNKEELTRAALDRLRGRAAEDGRAATGGWRDRLEVHLVRTAELALEYPAIAQESAVTDSGGPGDLAADEFILDMLHEGGLRGDRLVRAYAAISGFILSQSAALAHEVILMKGAARDGSMPWISTFGAVSLADYPRIRDHREALLELDGTTVYRAGFSAILDSVERWADV